MHIVAYPCDIEVYQNDVNLTPTTPLDKMYFKNIEPYIVRQGLMAVCLNIAQIVNGYGVAWSAPIIPKLHSIEDTPLPYNVSATEAAWTGPALYFGIVGAYVAGYVANIIGRRLCFIIGGILTILSYGLLTAAFNLPMLYAGRFFTGVSMSFLSVTCNIYIGEYASPNIRGIIHTSMGVFHSLGSLLAYSVGPYVAYTAVGYVAMGITAVYIVTSLFLPESPVYYVIKGNEEAAKEVLRLLGRSEDIDRELKVMFENAKKKETTSRVWRELFTVKSNRRGLFVTVPVFFFQQSSGIIAVCFYSTTIFKDAGSSIDPNIATIIVGAMMFAGTLLSPMFIEKFGRRILLIVSTSGLSVTLTLLGAYFYLDRADHQSVSSLGWLPLILLVLGIFSYSVGLNVIPHTLSGEMFEPSVRGLGSSVSLSTGWISGLIFTTIFGYMTVYIGMDITFWLFGVINAVAFVFMMAFVPETKGKSLTEIDTMMTK